MNINTNLLSSSPRHALHAVDEDPTLLSLGSGDEIERAVNKPRHILRAVIVEVQPQKVEPPRLIFVSVRLVEKANNSFNTSKQANRTSVNDEARNQT